jgi:hypothetical protein
MGEENIVVVGMERGRRCFAGRLRGRKGLMNERVAIEPLRVRLSFPQTEMWCIIARRMICQCMRT